MKYQLERQKIIDYVVLKGFSRDKAEMMFSRYIAYVLMVTLIYPGLVLIPNTEIDEIQHAVEAVTDGIHDVLEHRSLSDKELSVSQEIFDMTEELFKLTFGFAASVEPNSTSGGCVIQNKK